MKRNIENSMTHTKSREMPLKRLASEVGLIEALRNMVKRHIFFLEQSLELAKSRTLKERKKNHVDSPFQKLIKSNVKYEHVNNLKMDIQSAWFNRNSTILQDINYFINCIITFEDSCNYEFWLERQYKNAE
jgi:hypothetical protein